MRRQGRRAWGIPAFLFCASAATFTYGQQEKTAAPPPPSPSAVSVPPGTFVNPICRNAADPWLVYENGYYYLMHTVGWGVAVRRSPTLAGLEGVKEIPLWRGGGPGYEEYKHNIWAPEMHKLRGKWYIYYTASLDGPQTDSSRRIFCLESDGVEPLGPYHFKGKMTVPNDDAYAIDGTIFERPSDKALFFLWSGREAETKGAQNIYIAPMSDPWTISGPRVRLSTPTFDWEVHGWRVNEGPEVLTHDGKTFVTYSASGGTTSHYALGLLSNTSGDLLNASAWTKSPAPVFATYEGPEGHVYTVGHNGFFKSPDGTEDWIIYHGKENIDNTWGGRSGRAQKFGWKPDGSPDFGHPIPAGIPIPVPSGEGRSVTAPKPQPKFALP